MRKECGCFMNGFLSFQDIPLRSVPCSKITER
uniref:Uncharacterized protein n=1 Tax=Anguilla anguilla TaxID=7936 RepID=A0A0E9UMJ2_ANGAN